MNKECKECSKLGRGCKGEESQTPCLAYISKEEYGKDALSRIRELLKK